MKKFLLSTLFCLLAITSIQAEEVTFVAEGASYSGSNGVTMATGNIPGNTYASENIELSLTQKSSSVSNVNSNGHVRWYKYDILNVTPKNGVTITKIVFNTTGGEKYCVAPIADTGTATASTADNTITWEGATTSTLGLAADNGQIRFTTMTVTYTTEGGSVTPDQGGEGEGEGEGEGDELEVTDIADIIDAGAGQAKAQGTIVATYARGFLLDDGTGSILVYLGSDGGNAVGEIVTVEGKTSLYGGLLQFAAGSVVTKLTTTTVSYPTATVMDGAAMDTYLAAPAIKYVEYTGTLTINDNYYNVAVDGAATAIGSIQYPQDAIKANLTSGAVVKVTGYTIGVSSSKYVNTMAVKVEVVSEGSGEGETEVKFTTIAEVLAAGAGNAATTGTVVATYARGFLMNDGTGSILVYQGSDKGAVAGDAVEVVGATSMYGGLLQFGNTAVVTKTGTATVSHPTATVMDGAAMDTYLAAPAIKYVEYTGTLTINDNYYNVAVDGAATAIGSIQYPQDAIKANLTSGAVVKVTGYTIGVSSSKYVNTMAVKVEVIEGGEEPEVPTEVKEYTVAEALAAYVDGQQIPAIVTGYIVGAVNSALETGSQFGTDATIATNILISDNPDTNDYTECLIVQLPSGDIRSALNLVDNPSNYKKQVKITGSIEKYFKVAGLKSVTAYELTGVTGIIDVIGESNAVKTIFDITGRRIDNITRPGIYIVNGKKVLVK